MVNKIDRLESPVMITWENPHLDVFGTSIRTGLQKKFLVTNRLGSKESPCIKNRGLDFLVFSAPAVYHQGVETP
jgi:hypothetical protein